MAARLYSTASVDEQWHAVVGPWLRGKAGNAWKNVRPTVILTPSRAESFFLRNQLVGEGTPYLGLRFWTPSDARKFLHPKLLPGISPATQAELRLLARACATKLAAAESTSDRASITSVARDPAAFLRAYDLLLGAGWDPAKDGALHGRTIAREFQRALKKNVIATQSVLHRDLRRVASNGKDKFIGNILIVGFNATHWPLWDLLKASVFASEDTVVSLLNPRHFGGAVDHLWQGSWEEIAGPAADLPNNHRAPAESAAPFAELVSSYELGSHTNQANPSSANLTFLVTPDLASQTRAVVLQILQYLKHDDCTRLGVIFPSANALALGVASELRRLGIPLDDGTGEWTPGAFEQRPWQTWLALQEEPGVPRLIAWLRACEAQGFPCGLPDSLSAAEVAGTVDSALSETLVDDLNFLARHLEQSSRYREAKAVADFLRARIALPEMATFAAFLELTRQAITLPKWEEHLHRLEMEPPPWLLNLQQSLPRRVFLEWLKESTASQMRSRGADENHFYGKVHLVIYAQMTGQTWSHLILTGMNEGVWPRLHEAGAFGSRHELALLNQRVRELNPHSERRGSQGEGHETVGPDHGHCLLPLEQQELALRDLCAALDSTRVAASLTAMTTEGGRSLLPSDFFNHACQFKTGRLLGDDAFRSLARATETWTRQHASLLTATTPDPSGIATTRRAYEARRDAATPFGPYEFSYAQPPTQPIQLTCKQWEDAWRHPATTWLSNVIGATAWPEGHASWANAVGMWVHRWLRLALQEWREQPRSGAELPVLVWAAADREAAAIRTLARNENLALYPWWEQVWGLARKCSLQLAESLAPYLIDHAFLSEFTLPPDLMVALPGQEERDFCLKGRIDFLRIDEGKMAGDSRHPDLSDCACWVIDFKTGAAKALTEKNILKGTGLQAVLYALSVQTLGATAVSMSLLAPESDPKAPIALSPALNPILASLGKLHRDGIFGMRPDANADYGFAPGYPIATQSIPAYILEAKWELTHGAATEDDA